MGKYFREIQVPRFHRFPDSRGPDSRGFTVLAIQARKELSIILRKELLDQVSDQYYLEIMRNDKIFWNVHIHYIVWKLSSAMLIIYPPYNASPCIMLYRLVNSPSWENKEYN